MPSPKSISTDGVIETSLSDWHTLVLMVTKMHAPNVMPKNIIYRKFKTFNEDKYLQDLEEAPFHVAEIFTDIDDCYGFFETLLTYICNEHAPFKTRKARTEKPAAMKKTWHKAVMTKAILRHA